LKPLLSWLIWWKRRRRKRKKSMKNPSKTRGKVTKTPQKKLKKKVALGQGALGGEEA
jgi:hypothetical protein